MQGGKAITGLAPVLIIIFGAFTLTLWTDTAEAQSVQIKSQHVGDAVSYSGKTTPGGSVTVAVSSSTTTPVSGGQYNMQLGPITIPSCNVIVTVYPVQTVNFGGSMNLGLGIWTPEITQVVTVNGGNAGAYSYSAGAGEYRVRIFGTAASDVSSVTIDVSVSQQLTADGAGDYSISVSTAGLPAGVYTVTVDGQAVQRVYLGVEAPQTYTLNLRKGWNLISLPLVPQDNKITSIFSADQLSNIKIIWDYNGGNWIYFTTRSGYAPQFTTMSEQKGYYIYCYSPMSVQIIGSSGSGPISFSSLKTGWNVIGYPSTSSMSIADVYKSSYITWKLQNGNWYYYANRTGYTPQFTTLDPGIGYWVKKK